jgi:hypothetical protein
MRKARIILFALPAFLFGILALASLHAMMGKEDAIEFLKGVFDV